MELVQVRGHVLEKLEEEQDARHQPAAGGREGTEAGQAEKSGRELTAYSTLGLPARRAMGWVAPQQGGGQNARQSCPRPPEQQRHAVCSVYGVVFPSALQRGETGAEDADARRGPARCQPRKSKRQPEPKQKGQQIGGLQH